MKKRKPITPKTYPSTYRCVLCDSSIKKKELWSTEAMQLDDSSCVCESCLPRWNERQNKPLRELIGTVKIHKSVLSLLKEKKKDLNFQRDLKLLSSDSVDHFTAIMTAALNYPDMKKLVLPIVSLNTFHRTSLINTIISDLKLVSGPQQVISFLNALKDDDIAQKAKELLETAP